jgi:RNA polymerase sigma-70 factor, ECF subfamily
VLPYPDQVSLSDEELMSAVMAGDAASLRRLVERYHAPLLGFFFRLLHGDRAGAEDCVQETFLRLLQQRTYRPDRTFKPWLYAVAANLGRDRGRERARTPAMAPEEALAALPDSGPQPAELAEAREESRRVAAALSLLSEEYRMTLILRYYHDLTLQDIAETLGVPLGTVKSRLTVGTRRLRALLDPTAQRAGR